MVKTRGAGRHSSNESLKFRNLPPGVKVLVAYTSVITLFYLLYLLFDVTKPVSVIFGKFLYGPAAMFIELASLAVLIAIIYGLVKRHYWVFYISLTWFSFGLINAIISLSAFRSEFDVLRNVLGTSSFVVIVMNGIIVWYVYSEKEFFRKKHLNKETKAKDKFFVYIISVFLIVSILLLVTFGTIFYNTTIKTTDKIISELKDAPIPELVCEQKTDSEKDICYLVISIMRNNKDTSFCDNIHSDFYKITCYRALA